MAIVLAALFSIVFIYFTQKRRRRQLVLRGFKERILKLKEREANASGEELLAITNQLRFLNQGQQQYLSQKKLFF